MNVFIAGATGVIGRRLLPRLIRDGHTVTAITRAQDRVGLLRGYGAKAIVCDVFDEERLKQVLAEAEPEVVIHQLTSLPPRIDPRRVEEALAQTNKLGTEGTRILMEAAQARWLIFCWASSAKPRRNTTPTPPKSTASPASSSRSKASPRRRGRSRSTTGRSTPFT